MCVIIDNLYAGYQIEDITRLVFVYWKDQQKDLCELMCKAKPVSLPVNVYLDAVMVCEYADFAKFLDKYDITYFSAVASLDGKIYICVEV